VRRTLGLLAIAAVAAASAWPMQVTGDNQNAHYALVKALSQGMPNIDETLGETGDLQSHDVIVHDGRLYAVKSPGLAMAATPAYLVVESAGARTTGDPSRVLWFLNLSTSVLATLALLLLVRSAADRLEPGFGSATAVVLGLGALTLPFATLFFSHALSTALVFASFAVLVARDPTKGRLAASGLLAGLSVVVEHSVWIAAAAVGLYGIASARSVRSAAILVAGALAGALPLFAFNVWAFGNPLHTPYTDYWRENANFDATPLPAWSGLSTELFSSLGVLTLAPTLALGLAGSVLLFRRGRRAEAFVCVGVPLAFLVYFAGNGAFGGLGPPRYLTPIMPFALLPLAVALRRWPVATLAACAITCFQAVVMTATGPLAAYDGQWLDRAADRLFVETAASLVGVSGWYAIAPFFLAALVAAALGVASLPPLRATLADGVLAVGVAGAWAIVALASYNDWGRTPTVAYVLSMFAVVSLAAGAVVLAARRRTPVAQPAAP
jgi:hypothetical protein